MSTSLPKPVLSTHHHAMPFTPRRSKGRHVTTVHAHKEANRANPRQRTHAVVLAPATPRSRTSGCAFLPGTQPWSRGHRVSAVIVTVGKTNEVDDLSE